MRRSVGRGDHVVVRTHDTDSIAILLLCASLGCRGSTSGGTVRLWLATSGGNSGGGRESGSVRNGSAVRVPAMRDPDASDDDDEEAAISPPTNVVLGPELPSRRYPEALLSDTQGESESLLSSEKGVWYPLSPEQLVVLLKAWAQTSPGSYTTSTSSTRSSASSCLSRSDRPLVVINSYPPDGSIVASNSIRPSCSLRSLHASARKALDCAPTTTPIHALPFGISCTGHITPSQAQAVSPRPSIQNMRWSPGGGSIMSLDTYPRSRVSLNELQAR